MGVVRIGCSGWNYADWRGLFYPRELPTGRWLEHYARAYDTVEVNATFYRPPTRKSAARWAAQTPNDFVFAVKSSRYLTHVKRLRGLAGSLERLLEPLEALAQAGKLGPLLWQLPETFHRDDERLADALEALPPGRHCFEFRHPSWFVPEVRGLLREYDAALVVGDTPRRRFQTREPTASWAYVRFHEGRARERSYGAAALRTWSRRIAAWRDELDVYAYFNDDWSGHALREAARLRDLVERARETAAVH
jgi:uncharacterized protein YecE (DUF72 family)